MNDQELITFMNAVIKASKPLNEGDEITLTTLDVPIKDTGLDSLDCIMINIYLGEVFGVSSETIGEMGLGPKSKVRDMLEFMIAHKTKNISSIDEAMENLK